MNGKGRANSHFTLQGDFSTQLLGYVLTDGKPQACPLTRSFGRIKEFKNLFLALHWDPNPIICKTYLHHRAGLVGAYLDVPFVSISFSNCMNGIANEVDKDLPQQLCIRVHVEGARHILGIDFDRRMFEFRP